MFIRLLADTSATQLAEQALEYLHALQRIAPVRVGSMSGGLTGKWEPCASLMATPMSGKFINVVCCDPMRWSWEQQIAAPMKNGQTERFSSRIDLYTSGVRNVLIACRMPADQVQIATARKYECLIVPSETDRMAWEMNGAPSPTVIPIPVTDHDAFRAAVMG